MYSLYPELSKELIFCYITQEEIFERYTGYNPSNVVDFSSPLRADVHPSCRYYVTKSNNIRMRDYADAVGDFDCFDLVQRLYHVNFYETLKIIASDFGIAYNGCTYQPRERTQIVQPKRERRLPKSIRVKRRSWSTQDLTYWQQYGITEATLDRYHVSPAQTIWVNGKVIYDYLQFDPAYIYHFKDYFYKIYFPDRETYRFIGNCNLIQGFIQLPEEFDYLVITKSMKDVMALSEYEIPAIAPQAESITISSALHAHLLSRFSTIFILYDNDMAGKRGTVRTIQQYPDIIPLQIPDKFAKDFSDFYKEYGNNETIDLIKYATDTVGTISA